MISSVGMLKQYGYGLVCLAEEDKKWILIWRLPNEALGSECLWQKFLVIEEAVLFLDLEFLSLLCKLCPLICKLNLSHLCPFHPLNSLNLLIFVYICFSWPLLVSLPFFTSPRPLSVLGTQALERQKDFFDSIRSERDILRDEVLVLKEQLKVCKRNKINLYSSADPFPLCIWTENLNLAQ